MARLMLVRGGVEVMGQTASLLAKAAPSLPHHSSIGSLSQPMTIFLELWTSLTNYEHIGPREISSAPNSIVLYLSFLQLRNDNAPKTQY